MSRKTVSVKHLVSQVNRTLAHPDVTKEARAALCTLIESVLLEADQYAGFGYLDSEWKRPTYGEAELKTADERDEYRRVYYYAHN